MSDFQQNPVSRTVWPWTREAPRQGDLRPSPKIALLGLVIAWSIAGFIYWRTHEKHPTGSIIAVCVIGTISVTVTLLALFSPKGYTVVHKILLVFTLVVSKTMTWMLLVPFFYLAFPIGRLSQKIKGKDPLTRAFTSEESYWVARPKITNKEYYKRQS